MDQTGAHLVDHVFPHLPVRQWVLSVPKRLRYFMQRDGVALNSALRIFLRVIECQRRRQIDPACRFPVTWLDAPGIVAGCGLAAQHGGSVQSRHLGQISSIASRA